MQPLGLWKVLDGLQDQRAWLQPCPGFAAWASGLFSAELVGRDPAHQPPGLGACGRKTLLLAAASSSGHARGLPNPPACARWPARTQSTCHVAVVVLLGHLRVGINTFFALDFGGCLSVCLFLILLAHELQSLSSHHRLGNSRQAEHDLEVTRTWVRGGDPALWL